MISPQHHAPMLAASDGVRLLVIALARAARVDAAELQRSGFTLEYADSLGEAVRRVVADPPDAILALADVSSALSLCEVLRALGPHPLIVAVSNLAPDLATACLDEGADAAVALPLPSSELAARLRAVWHRAVRERQMAPSARIAVGDLVIDRAERTVFRCGEPIELSPTEFEVLTVLAENSGRVVTNRELLTTVWNEACADDIHYVRLYIGYLRSKLEDDPRRPQLILTQWGVGYRLATEVGAPAAEFARAPLLAPAAG